MKSWTSDPFMRFLISDYCNTTDQTEQNIDIHGHKVKLIDSAGIRDTKNKIEKKGVSKTYETLKKIDKFILVLSPDCNTRENFQAINDLIGKLDKKQTIYNLTNLSSKYQDFSLNKKFIRYKNLLDKSKINHKLKLKPYETLWLTKYK